MHVSSLAKMASFLRTYETSFPRRDGVTRLLEVGSKSYDGQPSYRSLITEDWIDYTGLDLEAGLNVDLVPKSGFVWPEIADGSFDVVISGQTFEHNPYFWVTMAEISRVLSPGGLACIIAPGAVGVHRFPVDCWRFYPDSWAPLCALTGLDPLEVFFEPDDLAIEVVDGHVRDCLVIARKPKRTTKVVQERLAQLTQPFAGKPVTFEPVPHREGPCIEDYRRTAPRAPQRRARLARAIHGYGPGLLDEPKQG